MRCAFSCTPQTMASQSNENNQSLPTPTDLTQTNSTNYRKSYAAATERDSFPSKDQAIVIESKQDIPLADYTTEIGKLVGPTNIRFASKISNGRVCMYLASKKVVENLTEKHGNIRIREHVLELRPLITKYKKLILSNACPIIPHSVSLSKIPESLQINYEDTSYWIYLTTDTLTCFLCKKPGHISKNCKTTPAAILANPVLSSCSDGESLTQSEDMDN